MNESFSTSSPSANNDLISEGGVVMTYNFDPDRWYENHRFLLDHKKEAGELDAQAFQAAVDELEREYEAMVLRLDGTYQLPKS